MDNSILKQATDFLHARKNSKRWHKVMICLAILVVVGTVAALIMPGQAKNHTKQVLECPLTVHQHTEACYSAKALALLKAGILTKEELTADDLICGQADFVVHTHNDDCYENGDSKTGALVCTLPEIEAHHHTEDCIVKVRRLICGLDGIEEPEGEAGDAPAEAGGSEPEALPQGPAPQTADNQQTVSGGDLNVQAPEQTGTTSDGTSGSRQQSFVVLWDESDLQTVSGGDLEAPDSRQQEPTSAEGSEEAADGTNEAGEPHVHTDACYEEIEVYVCGKGELHTHTADCYDGNGRLTCGMLEVKVHIHGEECLKTVELSEEEVALLNQQNQAGGTSEEEEDLGLADGEEDGLDEELLDVSGGDLGMTTVEYSDGKVLITATYGPEANLPEDARLQAYEVTPGSDRYEQRKQEALDAIGEEEDVSAAALEGEEAGSEESDTTRNRYQFVVYNIGFYVNGEEVEPEAPVNIKIQFLDENGMTLDEGLMVLHFAEKDEGRSTEVEVLDGTAEAEENSVNFNVDGFSDFLMVLGAQAPMGRSGQGAANMAFWYTMAGISLALTAGLTYRKKFRERRSDASRN